MQCIYSIDVFKDERLAPRNERAQAEIQSAYIMMHYFKTHT
jgi:hypothetical protein